MFAEKKFYLKLVKESSVKIKCVIIYLFFDNISGRCKEMQREILHVHPQNIV